MTGTTAVPIFCRYAAVIRVRPSGYSFLPVLWRCASFYLRGASEPRLPGVARTLARRTRHALPHVSAEDIVLAPDYGMKYLLRHEAFGTMHAMAAGA